MIRISLISILFLISNAVFAAQDAVSFPIPPTPTGKMLCCSLQQGTPTSTAYDVTGGNDIHFVCPSNSYLYGFWQHNNSSGSTAKMVYTINCVPLTVQCTYVDAAPSCP